MPAAAAWIAARISAADASGGSTARTPRRSASAVHAPSPSSTIAGAGATSSSGTAASTTSE